jgi:hypothetical protein
MRCCSLPVERFILLRDSWLKMGPEPILKAMQANPDFDILVARRAYDPAIFVAFCAINQADSPAAPLNSFSNTPMGGYYHMVYSWSVVVFAPHPYRQAP